jgi:hypothetical protein
MKALDSIPKVLVVEGYVRKDRRVLWGNKGMDGAVTSALSGPTFNVIGVGGIGQHLGIRKYDGEGLVVMESTPKLCRGSWQDLREGCFNRDSVHGRFRLASSSMVRREGREGRVNVGNNANEGMGGCPVAVGFDWVEIF